MAITLTDKEAITLTQECDAVSQENMKLRRQLQEQQEILKLLGKMPRSKDEKPLVLGMNIWAVRAGIRFEDAKTAEDFIPCGVLAMGEFPDAQEGIDLRVRCGEGLEWYERSDEVFVDLPFEPVEYCLDCGADMTGGHGCQGVPGGFSDE